MIYHQCNARFLRFALVGNAVFSAMSGFVFLFTAEWVATYIFTQPFTLFGYGAATIILELGVLLIIFAAGVLTLACQQRLRLGWVKAVLVADVIWVIESGVVLSLYGDFLTPMGFDLVALVGCIVLIFAIDQAVGLFLVYQGVSRIDVMTGGGRTVITASLETDVSLSRAWQVISDQEGYADVAENLSKVEALDDIGQGMRRRCWDTAGKSWTEICMRWEEPNGFTFKVDTKAADYPYPIAELEGDWSVRAAGQKTIVEMVFVIVPKPGLLNRFLFRIMAARFAVICDRLLKGWTEKMESRHRTGIDVAVDPAQSTASI